MLQVCIHRLIHDYTPTSLRDTYIVPTMQYMRYLPYLGRDECVLSARCVHILSQHQARSNELVPTAGAWGRIVNTRVHHK